MFDAAELVGAHPTTTALVLGALSLPLLFGASWLALLEAGARTRLGRTYGLGALHAGVTAIRQGVSAGEQRASYLAARLWQLAATLLWLLCPPAVILAVGAGRRSRLAPPSRLAPSFSSPVSGGDAAPSSPATAELAAAVERLSPQQCEQALRLVQKISSGKIDSAVPCERPRGSSLPRAAADEPPPELPPGQALRVHVRRLVPPADTEAGGNGGGGGGGAAASKALGNLEVEIEVVARSSSSSSTAGTACGAAVRRHAVLRRYREVVALQAELTRAGVLTAPLLPPNARAGVALHERAAATDRLLAAAAAVSPGGGGGAAENVEAAWLALALFSLFL